MKIKYIVGALAFLTFSSRPALAWDGVVTGKISGIDTTSSQNYDFRVYLNGAPACGSDSPGWVYMNINYPNYQATAALMTSSWLSSKTITVYTIKDGTGNCQIGYVAYR